MVEPRLVHVGIHASDLERSLRFWRDALGLRVVSTMLDCYDLTDGYHNFRLFQHRGPARPSHVSGIPTYLHIGLRVADLNDAVMRCQEHGFEVIWDGVDGGSAYVPGTLPAESFKVEDPDGIVVDVTASDGQWPGVTLGTN
jgi:catechol 2,3-dioxygenase-like lactoylglutathione lyase family enzyme